MKNQKGFVVSLIIAILAILISGGAYLYTKNKKTEVQNTGVITATISSDTSYWKTYKNEKYGLEFKYPPDWTVKGQENSSPSSIFNLELAPSISPKKYYKDVELNFVSSEFAKISFSQLGSDAVHTHIVIDDVTADKWTYPFESSVETSILIPFKGNVLILGQGTDTKVFENILSTFKLTE